jgi:hypothetical protein
MKRRIALFAAIFAISMLIGIQVVGVVNANPIPYPATPSQEKPTITIKNLQNYTTYGIGSMALDFSVVPPESWSRLYDFFFHIGYVKNVTVYLDGKLCGSFPCDTTEFSLILNQTALGTHKIEVTVISYSYYLTPVGGMENIPSKYLVYDGQHPYEYWTTVSDTLYFSTSASSSDLPTHIPATPTSSPTAAPSSVPTNAPTNNPTTNPTINSNTAPSPTQTMPPTSSPTPSQSMPTINTGPILPVELNPPIVYIVLAIVIVIVAVISISLVYFKKHSQELGGRV